MNATAMLAKMYGEGVPTFGDTKAMLGLDKKTYFTGRVGDLAIEIAYAEPRYAKRGEVRRRITDSDDYCRDI